MPYLSVDNFKFGLDARRSELTSNPGALAVATNGHINAGGQFDKRTKFGLFHSEISGQATFGFQEVGDAMLVFGSAATPAGVLTYPYLDAQIIAAALVTAINLAAIIGVTVSAAVNGSFTLTGPGGFTAVDSTVYTTGYTGILKVIPVNSTTKTITITNNWPNTFTVGITIQATLVTSSSTNTPPYLAYQRLVSPFTASMTAVISSCAFNNKAFVIAKFDDGTTLMFYDGVVIGDSYIGWVETTVVAGAASADALLQQMSDALSQIPGNVELNIVGHSTLNMTCTDPGTDQVLVGTWLSASGGTLTASITGTALTVTLSGTWIRGDHWSFTQTNGGLSYTIGFGTITQAPVTFCYTYNHRVYVLGGTYTYLSGIDAPTKFNDANTPGTGYINMSNTFGIIEPLVSCCHYQGRLAFFTRRTIQIWSVDAAVANFQQLQVMQNIGTFSPLGPQPVGDYDIIFPHDSGARSIRVRDSSLNAMVSDVGSPVDDLLVPVFNNATATELNNFCAIVDPSANRYWLYLKTANRSVSMIYVLSHYQVGKITAWSQYTPTYVTGGVVTPFTVQKFVLFQGRIYLRVNDGTGDIILYFDNVLFDSCVAVVELPWLSAKTPGHNKCGHSVDVAQAGKWKIEVSMDPKGKGFTTTSQLGDMTTPDETKDSTFDTFSYPFQGNGTHFKLRATSVESGADGGQASISSLIFHYKQLNEKV